MKNTNKLDSSLEFIGIHSINNLKHPKYSIPIGNYEYYIIGET